MATYNEFGKQLSYWRKKRRFSQLSFSLFADISARHLSFLETGRASPSREMIIKLASCLDMPKLEINKALLAAGFAPAYLARSNDDVDLAHIHEAIDIAFENHMPYPALALDSEWNIIKLNPSAQRFLSDAGFANFSNLLEALIAQTPKQSKIVNWEETIALLLERLHTEMMSGAMNANLEKYREELLEHFNRYSQGKIIDRSKAVIATKFEIKTVGGSQPSSASANKTTNGDKKKQTSLKNPAIGKEQTAGVSGSGAKATNGDNKRKVGDIKESQTISVFSTIAQFGSVQDLTLDNLKLELMFPLDKISKNYFLNIK